MPKSYKPLSCSKTDIIELNKIASSTDDPRLALRAKIVLECAEGKQVKDIAADLQERPNTVILWRKRFEEHGLQGLLNLPRGKNAFRYGTDLKDRLFSLLDTQPPDGEARWTGELLSRNLSVPSAVIWRLLRKEGISLSNLPPAGSVTASCEIPLQFTFRKEHTMKKDNAANKGDMMDLEITAKITAKDGTVIEKKIRMDDAIPGFDDFDFSTKEGFLRDFDKLESAILAARKEVSEGIVKEYGNHLSKKNGKKTK
ncbi:MAG: helix-turn-helix domain-containing protein [Treponema sp.]|nr:helix-turn-helix domain-containing protein [Treponema sp.]